jgi:hypothetical protein
MSRDVVQNNKPQSAKIIVGGKIRLCHLFLYALLCACKTTTPQKLLLLAVVPPSSALTRAKIEANESRIREM